ncbi:PREDICTED: transcription elongation factor B polypeptide 3 [Thamnophis sirtalis]|uniref:Elongin-A n=1 Tax=Thamnophis sirtalis TaxID=35019 RepID=A0A6I9XPH2_9SAUR|nr:PREDICTED: transcription elongation factor B polypeptide 3 [Thamnophis sirtalis]
MAESVLEDVRKLQSRLTSASEPKKLLKSLKRLSELPMTIDILQETGVGKSVNSLRKHEQVGIFAKNLVAIWKKLLPVSQEKVRHNLEPTEHDRNLSRKRHRDLLPKEGCSETHQPSCSQSYELDCGTKKVKRCSEPEKSHQEVSYGIPQDRSWRRGSSDQECSDYGHAVSSELSESPQELYVDLCHAEEQEKEQKSFSQKGMKSPPFQDRPEVTHHRHFSDSQEKPSTSQSKEPKSSHKERQRPEAKGEDKASVFSSERLPKASSSFHEASLPGSSKEKLKAPDSLKREKKKDGASSSGIKRQKTHFDLEDSLNEHRKKQKTHDLEKAKAEKIKFSLETICVDQEKPKPEGDFPHKNKEKKSSSSFKTSEAKPKVFESHKRPAGFSPPGEVEDEYEQPTMSFESYLSYDQPQKKKRKLAKPTTAPAPEKAHSSKQNGSKSSAKSSDASRKAPKPPSEKKPVEASAPKTKKILIDVLPMLPDIPLPPIQANYRPLPSLETVPFVQPKRKALSSPTAEDEAGFTGRRLNSKMQVYSGSKTAYLPKMMTLHEQCIRVLSNNIDSIYEIGGVPYSVLEPVLERCTPEQLYRIEECNHVLTEDTDQLWHNHCQRDFKKEKPDEFESWREMYLRLHDAREQRLLMLTQNIRSAHANKPKARVAKMAFVNSTVKPPREVRRRQEKFGTGGAAAPEKIKIKPVLFTATKSSSVHAEEEQDYDRPSTSSGPSCSSMGSTSSVSYDPRKPQVKKIAPMMAKTIKAFKNRFSRR